MEVVKRTSCISDNGICQENYAECFNVCQSTVEGVSCEVRTSGGQIECSKRVGKWKPKIRLEEYLKGYST